MSRFILKDAKRHAYYVQLNDKEFYFTDVIQGATRFDSHEDAENEREEVEKSGYTLFILEVGRNQNAIRGVSN